MKLIASEIHQNKYESNWLLNTTIKEYHTYTLSVQNNNIKISK